MWLSNNMKEGKDIWAALAFWFCGERIAFRLEARGTGGVGMPRLYVSQGDIDVCIEGMASATFVLVSVARS